MSAKSRQGWSVYMRQRRAEWRAAGMCSACGRERHDSRLCRACRASERERSRRAYQDRADAPSGQVVRTSPEERAEYVPTLWCEDCCGLPHRRGDVEDRTADGGWRRTGDVCPGCGLVREMQAEDLIMVAMASSAGFWAAAIPEAAE